MFKFFNKLFGKKTDTRISIIDGKLEVDFDKVFDLVRNSDLKDSIPNFEKMSDKELSYFLLLTLSTKWIAENGAHPLMMETHFIDDEGGISYSRAWNDAFVKRAGRFDFDGVPSTDADLIDFYMNYVYGVKLMEQLQSEMENEPVSAAHPELADPNHRFKT